MVSSCLVRNYDSETMRVTMRRLLGCTLLCFLTVLSYVPAAQAARFATDQAIIAMLRSGKGGIIVRLHYYKAKNGLGNDTDASDISSFQLHGAITKPNHGTNLYILPQHSRTKEQRCVLNRKRSFYFCPGEAGVYTITRLTLFESSGVERSFRIFKEVDVHSGLITYVGDIDLLSFATVWSSKQPAPWAAYVFRPKAFAQVFAQSHPKSARQVRTQALHGVLPRGM
jgi:hypothetical protein